jgi:diguanylate cyclase (GGDEF)-like protein
MHLAALRDNLTGAFSRDVFEFRLGEEIERARRYGHALTVLLLDIDSFKSINDAFGHSRGDQVLAEFVECARSVLRGSDLLFRYGGDEFVVILPHTTVEQGRAVAERMLRHVRDTPFSGTPALTLTISGGLAGMPHDGAEGEQLVDIADRRHYRAKRAGRNQIIADDNTPLDLALPVPPSRLIERDQPLETLQQFLDSLARHKRGGLEIVAEPGVGLSRFMAAVEDAARMRGYAVWTLVGSPRLRRRVYGTLTASAPPLPDLPHPSAGVRPYAEALTTALTHAGARGLIISVDGAAECDPATLQFLRDIPGMLSSLPVGLVYDTDGLRGDLKPFGAVESGWQARLAPLSSTGLRMWLRHTMQWEAPEAFLAWFYPATRGLPRRIADGLQMLHQTGQLVPVTAGWRLVSDLSTEALSALLDRRAIGPPTNLPAVLDPFLGRDQELGDLKELVAANPITVILGPGGQGKTRLALQVAAESLAAFPDGVFVVNLAAVHTPEALLANIAEALGISLLRGVAPLDQVQAFLHHRRLLLVLDNVEQLEGGEPLLAEIIAHAPALRLLLTSRKHLALPRTSLFELGGLQVPADEHDPDPGMYGAIRLFVLNARQIAPEWQLAPENLGAVTRLCRLVQGMPLAIVLAAARVRVQSCQEILDNIERNIAALHAVDTTIDERHRSVQAVVETFWQELAPTEHAVLRRLSIFRGGFRLEAAQAVAGASRFFLNALVTSGYLQMTVQRRYQMHELLRQYAAAYLDQDCHEQAEVAERHADFYTSLVEAHAEQLLQTRAALDVVAADLDNLRAAFTWAVAGRRFSVVERAVPGLARFYSVTCRFAEGASLLSSALEQARHAAEQDGALPSGLLVRLGVEVLLTRLRLGEYDAVALLAPEVVDWAKRAGAHASLAAAYGYWGEACARQGNGERAEALLEQATHQAANLQPSIEVLDVIYAMAASHIHRSDFRGASDYFGQGVTLSDRLGHWRAKSRFLNGVALAEFEQGKVVQAEDHLQEALPLFRELGDRQGEGLVLSNLAEIALRVGDYHRCQVLNQQVIAICDQIGDRLNKSESLICLSLAFARLGEHELARARVEEALQLVDEIGAGYARNRALTVYGTVLLSQGDIARAATILGEAREQWLAGNQPGRALEPLAGLLRIALLREDLPAVAAYAETLYGGLESDGSHGAYEPFLLYLACYHALAALHDPRAAGLLQTARARLDAAAAAFPDSERRDAFLGNVATHRELLRLSDERASAVL